MSPSYQEVPDPQDFWVTSWSRDEFSKMSYSYMALGSSGKDYDHMAADIEEKVRKSDGVLKRELGGRGGGIHG